MAIKKMKLVARLGFLVGVTLVTGYATRALWLHFHVAGNGVAAVPHSDSSAPENAGLEVAADAYRSVSEALGALDDMDTSWADNREAADLGELDPEWQSLSRSKFRAESTVAYGCEQGFRVELLVRNEAFNPRDSYISLEARAELSIILKSISDMVEPCRQSRYESSNREFEEWVSSGRARVLDIPVSNGMVNFNEAGRVGADMVSVRGGVVYGVMRSEMTETGRILEIENAMKLDIVAGLALWFKNVGALTDGERTTLITHAAESLL